MNLIKHIRVGIALLAIAVSASPVYAAYFTHPNASGTNPRPAPVPYNANGQTQQYGQDQQMGIVASLANMVTRGTQKVTQFTNNVGQQRARVSQSSPTIAAANLTGELNAAQVEVKASMSALGEAGKAVRGFFGMLPTPWTIGAAIAGYNEEREEAVAQSDDMAFADENTGQLTWVKRGQQCWVPRHGGKTADQLFKEDVVKKVTGDVIPWFMKDNKPDKLKIGGVAIPALLGLVVFKEEIAGAVKAVARKLLPKRFFQEKPATGILFKDLSADQQKHVRSQMGISGATNNVGYPVYSGRGVQQNAYQPYNLDAMASQLYQKGWWGYSRKR